MLARWRAIIKPAPANAAIRMGSGKPPSIRTTKGKTAAARTEASDANRNTPSTPAKMTVHRSTAMGEMARKAPKPVATPLPPRNFRKTGKQCPAITSTTASAIGCAEPEVSRSATRTARKPLPASSKKVDAAVRNPAARKTLVAPILPLPVERMSWPPRSRYSRYPNGMEPSRYAERPASNISRKIIRQSSQETRRAIYQPARGVSGVKGNRAIFL